MVTNAKVSGKKTAKPKPEAQTTTTEADNKPVKKTAAKKTV